MDAAAPAAVGHLDGQGRRGTFARGSSTTMMRAALALCLAASACAQLEEVDVSQAHGAFGLMRRSHVDGRRLLATATPSYVPTYSTYEPTTVPVPVPTPGPSGYPTPAPQTQVLRRGLDVFDRVRDARAHARGLELVGVRRERLDGVVERRDVRLEGVRA